jgi:hypothetical protein
MNRNDEDDVHGSRSAFDRYEARFSTPDYSNEPTVNGIPLSYYLEHVKVSASEVVICPRCKEWTDSKNPCCG